MKKHLDVIPTTNYAQADAVWAEGLSLAECEVELGRIQKHLIDFTSASAIVRLRMVSMTMKYEAGDLVAIVTKKNCDVMERFHIIGVRSDDNGNPVYRGRPCTKDWKIMAGRRGLPRTVSVHEFMAEDREIITRAEIAVRTS